MRITRAAVTATATACLLFGGVTAAAVASSGHKAGTADKLPSTKQALKDQYKALDKARADEAADPGTQAKIVADKLKQKAAHDKDQAMLDAGVPADKPGADWPTGIFQDHEAPAPGSVLLATNRWVGEVDGAVVAVYAGRAGDDETTGRVLLDWAAGSGEWIDLPGVGALTVVAAAGNQVTMAASDGTKHVLDVSTKKWTS